MKTETNLQTRLTDGDIIILDGATGTQLERLGAPMHSGVWCAAAIGSHPELVRQVHEEYIAVGADIITTNTYASGRASLAKSGLEVHFEAWNRAAINLAHEARDRAAADRPIYIAGSIAPYDHWGEYDAATMRASYREMANLHAEGNVDFLLLEMLATDIENSIIAIEEASTVDLPVWVSLSCLDLPETKELRLGAREKEGDDIPFSYGYDAFDSAIQQIMAAGGSVLSMMHSETHLGRAAVEVMRANYDGPLGVYPNAGYWERPNWTFIDTISPEYYWQEAQAWIAGGAQIIGGCCGTGPEHIRAVVEGVRG